MIKALDIRRGTSLHGSLHQLFEQFILFRRPTRRALDWLDRSTPRSWPKENPPGLSGIPEKISVFRTPSPDLLPRHATPRPPAAPKPAVKVRPGARARLRSWGSWRRSCARSAVPQEGPPWAPSARLGSPQNLIMAILPAAPGGAR
jgi:hypothetical protein